MRPAFLNAQLSRFSDRARQIAFDFSIWRQTALGSPRKPRMRSPLALAALDGDAHRLEALLSAGADPNEILLDGSLAFRWALSRPLDSGPDRRACLERLFSALDWTSPALLRASVFHDWTRSLGSLRDDFGRSLFDRFARSWSQRVSSPSLPSLCATPDFPLEKLDRLSLGSLFESGAWPDPASLSMVFARSCFSHDSVLLDHPRFFLSLAQRGEDTAAAQAFSDLLASPLAQVLPHSALFLPDTALSFGDALVFSSSLVPAQARLRSDLLGWIESSRVRGLLRSATPEPAAPSAPSRLSSRL